MKEAACKRLVLPILEYGGLRLDPHCNGLNGRLENVLKRAARFMTRNYSCFFLLFFCFFLFSFMSLSRLFHS